MDARRRTTLVAVGTICAALIGLHFLGITTSIEVFLRNIISPASKQLYTWSVTIRGEEESFDRVEDLERAYTTLKQDYVDGLVDSVAIELLEQENSELKDTLNFFSENAYAHVGAVVVGRDIDSVGSTVVIDVGSSARIAVGDPVIARDGILIGRVARIHEETAIVRLIDDHLSKFGATVMNSEKSLGVVEGGFGLSVRMGLIPQHESVEIGDIVITSGLEDQVPRGLIIGTIESIEREAHEPFQNAIIRPMQNLERIRTVAVIIEIEDV